MLCLISQQLVWLFFISLITLCRQSLIDVFVSSGFPSAIPQKLQEICELSSETSSSLSVCLSLLSKQEGVSVSVPRADLFVLFESLQQLLRGFLSIASSVIRVLLSATHSRTQVIISNQFTQIIKKLCLLFWVLCAHIWRYSALLPIQWNGGDWYLNHIQKLKVCFDIYR